MGLLKAPRILSEVDGEPFARAVEQAARSRNAARARQLSTELESNLAPGCPPGVRADLLQRAAVALDGAGDNVEAERLAREAIAAESEAPRAGILGSYLMFLSGVLERTGKWDEAIAVTENALTDFEKVFGKDHGETGFVRSLLAQRRKLRQETRLG